MCIFADIANDIGELERDAELAGISTGRRIFVAEYFRGKEADDAGNPVAIALERREVLIAILLEVHRHAVDDGVEMLSRQRILSDDVDECQRHRVLRLAAEDCGNFLAPPGEFHARDGRIRGLVDDVVDLATKGVQRRDGMAPRCGEETKAVGEA